MSEITQEPEKVVLIDNDKDHEKNVAQAAQNINRTSQDARNDDKDIADPAKGKGYKFGREKDMVVEKESSATISAVSEKEQNISKEVGSKEGTASGVKESSEIKIDPVDKKEENTQNQTQNQSQTKKPAKEEKQEEGEKEVKNEIQPEGKREDEERKITALGPSVDNSLGVAITGKGKDLEPTHFIGTQKRSLLENGQQVVELNIDKEAWMKALPDKNGMLKVSLHDSKSTLKDGFSDKVLLIPQERVKALQPDENGRLKLIVAENEPGKKNSKIEVFEDNAINRERIVSKNPNPLGDTPELQRERALDSKLEHGFYGYKMDVTMKDVRNNMPPEKQAEFDKLDYKGVKAVIDDPANKQKYTEFEEKLETKKLDAFKQGKPLEVNGSAIGKDDVGVSKINFEKAEGDKIHVKDEKGQSHVLDEKELLKGSLQKQDEERIRKETLKEIASGINVNPSIANEKAQETKVTEKTTYKEYVDNMTPGEQAEVKNKPANEVKENISDNKDKLRENEKNVLEGRTVDDKGDLKEKPDPSKELSKAILNGKKEDVDNILKEGIKPDQTHVKLMNEMKSTGRELDPGIENAVKAAMPEQSTKIKV